MRNLLCLGLLAVMCAGGCGGPKRADDVAYFSLMQLIAAPQLHDGKRVLVVGYLRLDSEGTALYMHEIDYQKAISKNAIWLDLGIFPASVDQQRLNGHYVLAEGRFSAANQGRGGIFSGAISPITSIEPWPPNNTIIPPGDPRQSPVN